MGTTRQQRNDIRDHLNLNRNNRYPIKIVPGNHEPTIRGESYFWITLRLFTFAPPPSCGEGHFTVYDKESI